MFVRSTLHVLAVVLTSVAALGAAAPAELFPLSAVRLLDGPFRHAQQLNAVYLLRHDADRLLAPYRREAGLPPKAAAYPNWESSGLDGHTLGHYLTALAQEVATTHSPEARERLNYVVAELAACQAAHGNGYVGPIPNSSALWSEVQAGQLRVEPFSVNGRWVPWYNLHKLFAGLRDAWWLTGHEPARDVLVGLSDWCEHVTGQLSDEQMQDLLRAEHGGMNEVLADVAAITGDARYLRLARRFSHRAVLEPLRRQEDRLTGLHANTQIPKAIGFARIAELDGSAATADWADAARFFWSTVVDRRSVAFGGNSVREHFNAPDDFAAMVESREGPETCNTYNMLRLSEQLFRMGADARYADYYEQALFNHILSSQHPGHGGFVYFTPIRPAHYRVYSQPEQCFWCCVGSGLENHGKYGRFIYAHQGEDLLVNLFLASELTWEEKGLILRQETAFPDEPRTRLEFRLREPRHFRVHLRHPEWVKASSLVVRINGRPAAVASTPSSYAVLEREWRDGDQVEVELPMRSRLEPLPDGSDYVAIVHGPIVLAAKTDQEGLDGLIAGDGRMAHIAPGAYRALESVPMLVGERQTMAEAIEPIPGRPLTFRVRGLIQPEEAQGLVLEPFARVHDSRYMMYWRAVAPADYAQLRRDLRQQEEAKRALELRTLDAVAPGEQQPEVEHQYDGEDAATGVTLGRHWRDARGWFGYTLRGEPGAAMDLVVTYAAWERDRAFTIKVNDREIARVQMEGNQPDRFVDVTYALPRALTDAAPDGLLQLRFRALEGRRTASIFGVRLVKRAE
jgi:uncharacterized protein